MVDVATGVVARVPRWRLFKGRTEPGKPIGVALKKIFNVSPAQLAHAQWSPRLFTMPYLLARESTRPPLTVQPIPGLRGHGMRLELEHGLAIEATRILRHAGMAWCLSPALVGEGIQGDRCDDGRWYTLRKADVVEVEAS